MLAKPLFGAIALSTLLGLTACATDPTTHGTTNSESFVPKDDATLNESVTQAVSRVPGLDSRNLNISTLNGVVSLTGRAATRAQAQDAIEAARHVPGVQTVDYDIDVEQP